MSTISSVLLFAVAAVSTCTPSAPPPPPAGGGSTGGGVVVLPEWTTGDTEGDPNPGVLGIGLLVDVRHGTHAGFDRMVFEFEGPIPAYEIAYVDKPTWQCGSGAEVWLDGDAWLRIDLEPAAAHTDDGQPTLQARSFRSGYEILLEAEQVCDYEAIVSWVAGNSSPNGYRVFDLADPARLVVDFRH